MRLPVALSFLLICSVVQAIHLDYFSGRNLVERQCLTNRIPRDERIFLGRTMPPTFFAISHFHKGLTVRQLIDHTALRGKTVSLSVMRLDYLKAGPFTRYERIKVGPSEDPEFELKALDVLWFYDDSIVVE